MINKDKWEALADKGIYRRSIGHNNYEYMYRASVTINGKKFDTSCKKSKTGEPFLKKQEAIDARNAHLKALKTGERNPNSADRKKLDSLHYIDNLFEDYKAKRGNTLSPNSLKKYETNIKKHIVPAFESRRIESITAGELNNFLIQSSEDLAIATLKGLLSTLRKIWLYALELEIIDMSLFFKIFDNPHTRIRVPISKEQKGTKEIAYYEKEQIQVFLYEVKRTEEPWCLAMLYLCFYGGLRRGEALGLLWENVDFLNNTITVKQQLCYNKLTHVFFIDTPKSNRTRVFPAPPALMAFLKDYKAEQTAHRKQLGKYYQNGEKIVYLHTANEKSPKYLKSGDFVLRTESGEFITPSRAGHLRERMQHNLDKDFKFHVLRHSILSLLVDEGVPQVAVKDY